MVSLTLALKGIRSVTITFMANDRTYVLHSHSAIKSVA